MVKQYLDDTMPKKPYYFPEHFLSPVTQGFPVSGLCPYRSERGREVIILEEGPLPFWRIWGSETFAKEHKKINRKNGCTKKMLLGGPGALPGGPIAPNAAK